MKTYFKATDMFINNVCVCDSHSVVSDSVTPLTVDHQASLSVEFSRQYWNGLPFPSAEDLPTQGLNPGLLHLRQLLYHLSYREILIINN